MTASSTVAGRDDPGPDVARNARVAAFGVLALLVPLPLLWEPVAGSPVGVLRYHHIGALVLVVLAPVAVRGWRQALGSLGVLVSAMVVMTTLCVLTASWYGGAWLQPIQHALYAGVGIVLAGALHTALHHDVGRRLLMWGAPLSVSWTLVEIGRNLRASGVNPLLQIQQALLQVDPNVLIFSVYRTGLSAGDTSEPASIRHEVMAALLVVVLVALLARRAGRRVPVVTGVACAVAVVVIVLSLSRAVLLPIVLAGAAVGVRDVLRASISRLSVVLSLVGVGVLAVAGPALVNLLLNRLIGDSGSYEARLSAFNLTRNETMNRLVAGGPDLRDSPHMLIADVVLQGGWLAGAAALVVVLVFARFAWSAFRRYLDEGDWADLIAFTACALVLSRAFTSGGGYLNQAEWAAFGIAVAVAANARPTATYRSAITATAGTRGR